MLEETLNKALDYTRGNNTYLQCVNKNLEHAALAVRNMESGFRGDIQDLRSDFQSAAVGMYNMGQGIRNDIQDMALGMRNEIRSQTYDILVSQQMLADTFSHGFNAVTNTLNISFNQLGNKIDVLSEEICSKLDQIHDILNNPRLTESRELYRQALTSYKKGFYEEALEDCLGAVEKNKTDFISWYLLGLIYLFGAGKFSNVINLDKAEEALLNAAKYIDPDIGISEEANKFASEVYFNLGLVLLAKSNDFLIENKIEDSNTKLLEAQNATAQAYSLSKENLIAGYEYAKELHFLGKDSESLKLLEELIRKEKNFAIKSVNDKNFESLWGDIEKLIEKLKLEVCNSIREELETSFNKFLSIFDKFYEDKIKCINEEAFAIRDRAKKYALEQKQDCVKEFSSKWDEILTKSVDIENKDYFFVLNLLEYELPSVFNELEEYCHNISELASEKCIEYEIKIEDEWIVECNREEEERKEKERWEQNERWKQEEEHRKQEEKKEKISGLILGAFIGLILGLIALGFSDLVPSPGDWDFFPIGLIHIICAVIGFALSGILGAIVGLIIVFGSLLLLLVFPMVIVIILVIVGAVWGCVARTKS